MDVKTTGLLGHRRISMSIIYLQRLLLVTEGKSVHTERLKTGV